MINQTKMKKKVNLLFLVGFVFLITSCDSNVIYEKNQSFNDNKWTYDDVKTFSIEMQEDTTPVKIYINLRTTIDYPYSNIYMYLYSDFPNGYSDIDTLEFFLAKPDGQWLGEVSGTVVENRALITKGYLMDKGTYTFKLEQAMYNNDLPEVLDVGIRVENWNLED